MATSPLPSWRPKRGRDCGVTLAFSGVPNAKRGEKIRSGYLTPAFLGAQKGAGLLRNPCILGGPQRQARGENQKWLPRPCLPPPPKRGRDCGVTPAFSGIPNTKRGEKIRSGYLTPAFLGGPKRGRDRYVTPAFSGIPNTKHGEKIRSGYLTPAFLGSQKGAGLLCNPYILGDPQHQARGEN